MIDVRLMHEYSVVVYPSSQISLLCMWARDCPRLAVEQARQFVRHHCIGLEQRLAIYSLWHQGGTFRRDEVAFPNLRFPMLFDRCFPTLRDVLRAMNHVH